MMTSGMVFAEADEEFATDGNATLSERAHALLLADILSGSLQPGSKLAIRLLSERYGIGPTPIREALSRLSQGGLVQALPRLGFLVSPHSRADLEEIVWLRRQIECEALRRSMDHGGSEWEGRVAAATHLLIKASRQLGTEDVVGPDFDRIHKRFHYTLISACQSARLLGLFGTLYDQTYRYRRLAMAHSDWATDFAAEHIALSALVLGDDVAAACNQLDRHLHDVLKMAYDTRHDGSPQAGWGSRSL